MAEKIRGMNKLMAQLKKLGDADYAPSLLAGAYILQAASQRNAPVETGFLRNSHTSRVAGKNWVEMVVSTNYAFFVEYGTKKWAGHPFIRPAMDTESDRIVQAIGKALNLQVKGEL